MSLLCSQLLVKNISVPTQNKLQVSQAVIFMESYFIKITEMEVASAVAGFVKQIGASN